MDAYKLLTAAAKGDEAAALRFVADNAVLNLSISQFLELTELLFKNKRWKEIGCLRDAAFFGKNFAMWSVLTEKVGQINEASYRETLNVSNLRHFTRDEYTAAWFSRRQYIRVCKDGTRKTARPKQLKYEEMHWFRTFKYHSSMQESNGEQRIEPVISGLSTVIGSGAGKTQNEINKWVLEIARKIDGAQPMQLNRMMNSIFDSLIMTRGSGHEDGAILLMERLLYESCQLGGLEFLEKTMEEMATDKMKERWLDICIKWSEYRGDAEKMAVVAALKEKLKNNNVAWFQRKELMQDSCMSGVRIKVNSL